MSVVVPTPELGAIAPDLLEPDLLEWLRRLYPEVVPSSRLRLRRLRVTSTHWMTVVETREAPVRRLLVKGPPRYRPDGSLAVEGRVLALTTPGISAVNPRLRTPQLIASDPERQLLVLELVDGRYLYSIVAGLATVPAVGIAGLLDLAAEWLARFHALTETSEEDSPFACLADGFARPEMTELLDRYAGPGTAAALASVARAGQARHPGFRRRRCLVHGRFAPYNILVRRDQIYGDQIYVVDLETVRSGHRYEDLAHFLAYYDMLFPWRRTAAKRRLGLADQQRQFVDAYGRHGHPSGEPEGMKEPEGTVMRLARILAMATHARDLQKSHTWRWWLRARAARIWHRRCLRTAVAEELGATRGR